jgi:hypothetical protein
MVVGYRVKLHGDKLARTGRVTVAPGSRVKEL